LSKQGILVHPAGSHAVVMAPVLTFSKVECDQVVEKLMYTFGTISKLLNI
jgi:acetylornithine/succinyldiaminopimelate/putrescine aminotransferase